MVIHSSQLRESICNHHCLLASYSQNNEVNSWVGKTKERLKFCIFNVLGPIRTKCYSSLHWDINWLSPRVWLCSNMRLGIRVSRKAALPKTSSEQGVVPASAKTGRWWETSLANNRRYTMQPGVPTQSWYIQTDLSLLENRSVLQIK